MKKIILVLAFSAFGYLSLRTGVSGMAVYESSTADFKSNFAGNRSDLKCKIN
jgi:hypothetical protein